MSGQWPPEWEDSDTGLPDEWTDSDAGLDPEASEVTLFLASVPGPVLPASFEARISAAIAAEATARANGTASAGTEPAGRASADARSADTASAGAGSAGTESVGTQSVGAGFAGAGFAGAEAAGTELADAGIAAAGTNDAKATDRSSSQEVSPAAAESGSATGARRHRRRTSAASRSAAAKSRPAGSRPDGRRRRFRLPNPAVTAPLLVVLVIVGFGILFTQIGGGSATYSSPDSGGTSAQGAASPTSGEHRATFGQAGGSEPQYEAGPSTQFSITESGTSYHGSTLARQVRMQLLALAPSAAATPAPTVPNSASATAAAPAASSAASAVSSASASSGPAQVAPGTTLKGCVYHLTGGKQPELVDRGTYDGIPAYIIALSSRVWVVRLGCTATDPQEITSVSLSGLGGNLSALGSVEGYASPGERRMQ